MTSGSVPMLALSSPLTCIDVCFGSSMDDATIRLSVCEVVMVRVQVICCVRNARAEDFPSSHQIGTTATDDKSRQENSQKSRCSRPVNSIRPRTTAFSGIFLTGFVINCRSVRVCCLVKFLKARYYSRLKSKAQEL